MRSRCTLALRTRPVTNGVAVVAPRRLTSSRWSWPASSYVGTVVLPSGAVLLIERPRASYAVVVVKGSASRRGAAAAFTASASVRAARALQSGDCLYVTASRRVLVVGLPRKSQLDRDSSPAPS